MSYRVTNSPNTPYFRPGKTVVTIGAVNACFQAQMSPDVLLARHITGDWGEITVDEERDNEDSRINGCYINSTYTLPTGVKVWIITDAGCCTTTILLPWEY